MLALVESFPHRRTHRKDQTSTGPEFIEEPFFHRLHSFLVGGNTDEIMSFMRIGLKIIETIVIPDPVVIDIFVSFRANGKERRCGWEIPLPVIFIYDMVAPGNRLPLQ